ncbi:methyl-accepting chemotaxis protein [Chitinibacter bivalviorum]|uniref:Methyl-accepting chemotaxis protein n=1 Tax=Chitinibacter bivalviorum TaxID=2739434 RepID=A0A7H9BL74_9NEIS|nr:methyl-accepting chemotaxis protein [Chitinibacter bivalviorum]QLG89018.1 methyl-accepting chemotaxis protein [Chitinibacter bivalviorum]
MKIAHKLMALIGLTGLAILILTGVGYYNSGHVKSDATEITAKIVPGLLEMEQIQRKFARARYAVLYHVILTDAAAMKKTEEDFASYLAQLEVNVQELSALHYDDTDAANFAALKTELDKWKPLTTLVFNESRQEHTEQAMKLIREQCAPQAEKVYVALKQISDYKQKIAEKNEKQITNDIAFSISFSVICGLITLLTVSLLGWLIGRSVTQPLSRMQHFLQKLGQDYDFTRRLEVQSQDEIGVSLTALNGLLDTLQGSLRQLTRVGRDVSGSVTGLSNTSHELSQASHAVSESASAMASGVEEVTVSISHVADRAQECDHTAREAGRLAATGGNVIENTIASINLIADQVRESATQIESLKERTANINAVVTVIKDIADQTNLLALNAAIEAARAGDMGRGFAVVADEVRKLAERTANSTQEIISTVAAIQNEANSTVQTMQHTVRQVDEGVARAQEASSAIGDIRASADLVVHQVGEISAAMRDQSGASAAMAQQVERVAQMSEESSAAAASTANESQRLNQLGQELDQSISRYRI